MIEHLHPRFVDKPWGRFGLDPCFAADPGRQLGELWFEREGKEPLGVLAKYLFTTQRLSIQVHPDEATAHARGLPHGKDEFWIVLDAEPGAVLGIGTRARISTDAFLAAARDGSIEQLIDWRPARAGQFFYNPAGTVHALGAGLTILEVQQPSDVTYRLFDYGRPRELHLDESRAVVDLRPHSHPADCYIAPRESSILVDGPWFGLAWCFGSAPTLPLGVGKFQILPIDAPIMVGSETVQPGHCALIDDATALVSEGAFALAWALSQPAKSRATTTA
jgi:mannose-6-phosphate isomerase